MLLEREAFHELLRELALEIALKLACLCVGGKAGAWGKVWKVSFFFHFLSALGIEVLYFLLLVSDPVHVLLMIFVPFTSAVNPGLLPLGLGESLAGAIYLAFSTESHPAQNKSTFDFPSNFGIDLKTDLRSFIVVAIVMSDFFSSHQPLP